MTDTNTKDGQPTTPEPTAAAQPVKDPKPETPKQEKRKVEAPYDEETRLSPGAKKILWRVYKTISEGQKLSVDKIVAIPDCRRQFILKFERECRIARVRIHPTVDEGQIFLTLLNLRKTPATRKSLGLDD